MNTLTFGFLYFLLLAQPAEKAPEEKISSIQGLNDFNAADLRLEALPKDTLLKDQKDPLALVSFKSYRFPKRKDPLRYIFARGEELTEPPALEPPDPLSINPILDIKGTLVEFVLNDMNIVLGAPYFLPAAVLEIEQVAEVSIKPDDKSGTPELLKTEVIFKNNSNFEKIIFFSRSSIKIEDLPNLLPDFDWMKRCDLAVKLPIDPRPTEKIFEVATEPSFKFDFSGSRMGEVGSSYSSMPSLEEFMRTPQWQTQRGFDHWGYYERSRTSFPNGGSLEVEIRRYDRPLYHRHYRR